MWYTRTEDQKYNKRIEYTTEENDVRDIDCFMCKEQWSRRGNAEEYKQDLDGGIKSIRKRVWTSAAVRFDHETGSVYGKRDEEYRGISLRNGTTGRNWIPNKVQACLFMNKALRQALLWLTPIWDFRPYGMLRSFDWQLVTDVSGNLEVSYSMFTLGPSLTIQPISCPETSLTK
jgi:hypothetical protein